MLNMWRPSIKYMRVALICCLLGLVIGTAQAQEEIRWIDRMVDSIAYQFPEAYTAINHQEATGVAYQGGNFYLTVTSFPDTAGVDPTDSKSLAALYQQTIDVVLKRLRGRLRDARDTTVMDLPAYFASVEVSHGGEQLSRYDLLQVYKNGKVHGFSCQHEIGSELAEAVHEVFFAGVGGGAQDRSGSGLGGLPLWSTIVIVLLLGFLLWMRLAVKRK